MAPAEQPLLRRYLRMALTLVLRLSAAVLACCMIAIVGFPHTVGYSWVYGVALGSAAVCAASAMLLKKLATEEAADDAAWLLSFRDRGSRNAADIDADD